MDDVSNTGIAAEELKQFVERLERVQDEIDGLNGDKKEVYAEAKGRGFCTKTLKQVIALRRKPVAERQEQEAILTMYLEALGM